MSECASIGLLIHFWWRYRGLILDLIQKSCIFLNLAQQCKMIHILRSINSIPSKESRIFRPADHMHTPSISIPCLFLHIKSEMDRIPLIRKSNQFIAIYQSNYKNCKHLFCNISLLFNTSFLNTYTKFNRKSTNSIFN